MTSLGKQHISSAVHSPTSQPHPSLADQHRTEPLSPHSIPLAGIPLTCTCTLCPARPLSAPPATPCRPGPLRPTRPRAAAPRQREHTSHAPRVGHATHAANHRRAGTCRSHRLTSRGNRAGSGHPAGRVPRVNGPASLPAAGPAQGRRQAGQLGRRNHGSPRPS